MVFHIHTRSAENKLMEMLGFIHEPRGWAATHFHLNEMAEQYRSEYQLKIAINLVHDLLKDREGGAFLLNNNSLMVVAQRLEPTVQHKLIFQLRYLFMDDPLAYGEDGQDNPNFCTTYDLGEQFERFTEMCTRLMASAVRKPESRASVTTNDAARVNASPKPAVNSMNFERLILIERDLLRADLQKVVRRQPVCAVLPNMTVRRVFDELYINIAHLRELLKAEVELLSNKWLFKYLTSILDQRVIDMIKNHTGLYLNSPISLNLNVESVLSGAFTDLDALIKPSMKVSMVVEIPVVDVFADMQAFKAAKSELQRLGYRVCLDGLTSDSFVHISRDALGVDLVKVQWNPHQMTDVESKDNLAISSAVSATGSNRVILCRCDSKEAIKYGQALGISLFQGRYLDGLLNPTAKVQN